jgi:hypothetical protein
MRLPHRVKRPGMRAQRTAVHSCWRASFACRLLPFTAHVHSCIYILVIPPQPPRPLAARSVIWIAAHTCVGSHACIVLHSRAYRERAKVFIHTHRITETPVPFFFSLPAGPSHLGTIIILSCNRAHFCVQEQTSKMNLVHPVSTHTLLERMHRPT